MFRLRAQSQARLLGARHIAVPENKEGGIAAADSTIGQKYQRAQMEHNRFNNLMTLLIVMAPVAVYCAFRCSKYSNIWVSWSDPYALPKGFDPNVDPPPASAAAEPRRPMMTTSAPGGFSVVKAPDAHVR